jgi:hypothetical protein
VVFFVDQKREVEKSKGENKFEELRRMYGKNEDTKKDNGYLICKNCLGYYKLKEDESPEDFKGCECGGPLEYTENLDNLRKPRISSSTNEFNSPHKPDDEYKADFNEEYYDEYEELQQIVDVIRVKAQERKKFMEKLYENVQKQEIILNNISEEQIAEVKDNDWSLWDLIEEKDMKSDINSQKMIIDDIIEKEKHLISYVKDKRNNKPFNAKSIISYPYAKIGILTLMIIFLSIIAIYAIK